MKKIIYLILLLTCHLWSTQLWGALVKVGVSEGVDAGNIANNPYVSVTMDDSANWGSNGHGAFAYVSLNFNFEYHYINEEGGTLSINVAHTRNSKYIRGTKLVVKYLWKQPEEPQTQVAANWGYHLITNGPRVTITLRPGNGYTVDAAHSEYVDGVPLYYSDWQSDDNEYYDLSDDTITHYLDGHCVSEDPRLTRHLLHHRKTVYSISQGTENDK